VPAASITGYVGGKVEQNSLTHPVYIHTLDDRQHVMSVFSQFDLIKPTEKTKHKVEEIALL
jgi:hypothetical protein